MGTKRYGKGSNLINVTRASSGYALTKAKRGEELSDGVVNSTQGAATINGTEVTFAGQYANARGVVSVESGSAVQIQITAKVLSGNTNLHFFHENSEVLAAQQITHLYL